MKKYFYLLAVVTGMVTLASCTNDDLAEEAQATEKEVQSEVLEAAIQTRARGAMKVKGTPAETPQVERISYKWEYSVDIFEHFPEFITPEGYYDNFLYVSNGEPFELVMLYSNGGYRHDMGLYWYDEDGDCHEKHLWQETDDEKARTWVNFNGTKNTERMISRVSDDAGAYRIQLPKGTKFGFYCHSTLNGNEVKEGIRTPLPYGPIVDYTYKFYTETQKNWSYMVAEYDKYAENGKTTTQAMCTNINGWTIVGFEDMSITYPSCDRDYNDCVFAMNPCQPIDGEPVSEKVDGSVETNLSVADKGTYDQVKLSIHVRANTDVSVVLPIADPILADDFAIAAKHDIEASYSEPLTIAGKTVKLIYSITAEGYLKIETQGITQEILDYCNATYADGLTFECNLAYGKFNLEDTPTISFTKEPYVYVTTCANGIAEANDYEVIWKDTKQVATDLPLDPKYIHRYYSGYTLEELKTLGFLKTLELDK